MPKFIKIMKVWITPLPSHFDDYASPNKSKIISRLSNELYQMRFHGLVRGDEQYKWVILFDND
jgi:hypothetical protein